MKEIIVKCEGAASLPLESLLNFQGELKDITAKNLTKLQNSILRYGFSFPIHIWDSPTGYKILDGHQRRLVLQQLKNQGYVIPDIPVTYIQAEDEKQAKEKLLLLNSTYGKFQKDVLEEWLLDLQDVHDLVDLDIDIDALMGVMPYHLDQPSLMDDFGICPFSVLDARQGNWVKRKRALKEEIGDFGQARHMATGMSKNNIRDSSGKVIQMKQGGVSILDPVLAELMIKWFSIRGELLIDPFAGDTAFGFMAGKLGRSFKGIELRSEQCEFNNNRVRDFDCEYICDTGVNIAQHIKQPAGMVFSCPPYFNLEKYSNDPLDASNMEYNDFLDVIQQAFQGAYEVLSDNRFFIVVISDVRVNGNYLGMPDKFVAMLQAMGLKLYNRMILLEPLGTAAYRARRYFQNRKIAKVHQEIFVFYKGDTSKISTLFTEIEGVDFDSVDEHQGEDEDESENLY